MPLILAIAAAAIACVSAYQRLENSAPDVLFQTTRGISRRINVILAIAKGIADILAALSGSRITVGGPPGNPTSRMGYTVPTESAP